MNKYQNGKNYKIINDVNPMVYIGSTTTTLDKRMAFHYSDAFLHNSTTKFHQFIREYGINHFKIILLCDYPCNTYKELLWQEQVELNKIEQQYRLNHQNAFYNRNNKKEHIKKQRKEYSIKNKELLKKRQQEWYKNNIETVKIKDSKRKKEFYIRTTLLRLLPLYNVNQKETHLYF